MRFAFENLIHWRRHLGWQEKLKAKFWRQGSLPLTTIKMDHGSVAIVDFIASGSVPSLKFDGEAWKIAIKRTHKSFVEFHSDLALLK